MPITMDHVYVSLVSMECHAFAAVRWLSHLSARCSAINRVTDLPPCEEAVIWRSSFFRTFSVLKYYAKSQIPDEQHIRSHHHIGFHSQPLRNPVLAPLSSPSRAGARCPARSMIYELVCARVRPALIWASGLESPGLPRIILMACLYDYVFATNIANRCAVGPIGHKRIDQLRVTPKLTSLPFSPLAEKLLPHARQQRIGKVGYLTSGVRTWNPTRSGKIYLSHDLEYPATGLQVNPSSSESTPILTVVIRTGGIYGFLLLKSRLMVSRISQPELRPHIQNCLIEEDTRCSLEAG
jgi:hypothetical protein